MLQRELDEIQRRLAQLESEKRTMVGQLENTKRDRATFIKKIEVVTIEKCIMKRYFKTVLLSFANCIHLFSFR